VTLITFHNQTADVLNALQGFRDSVRCIHSQSENISTSQLSPHELASQALYAERGSDEGAVDYELHQSAQAQFGHTLSSQPSQPARFGEMESQSSPLTQIKVEERDSTDLATSPADTQAGGNGQQRSPSYQRHICQLREAQGRAFHRGQCG
jgi:hypothetical protein